MQNLDLSNEKNTNRGREKLNLEIINPIYNPNKKENPGEAEEAEREKRNIEGDNPSAKRRKI